MKTLKEIKKDRRCKLSDHNVKNIIRLYNDEKYTMMNIAGYFGVSHQRISQIVDRNGTMEDVRKEDARKFLERYRTDKNFHAKMLLSKKECYRYKTKMILKYGK